MLNRCCVIMVGYEKIGKWILSVNIEWEVLVRLSNE